MREAQEGEDICIHIADSLYYTAETNTALQSNYTPIKKIKYNSKTNKQTGKELSNHENM